MIQEGVKGMRSPFEIGKQPTTVNRMHESIFRAYAILDLVRDLLRRGTPGDVVLDPRGSD
jgi:hypothetical protein